MQTGTFDLPAIDPTKISRLHASAEEAASKGARESEFIGASVLTSDGRVFEGRYIRGATCYTTIHAEAAAVVQALVTGSTELVAVALCAWKPIPHGQLHPCGTCLQLLAEHACGPNLVVWMKEGTEASWQSTSLGVLLPSPWVLRNSGRG